MSLEKWFGRAKMRVLTERLPKDIEGKEIVDVDLRILKLESNRVYFVSQDLAEVLIYHKLASKI